MLNCSQLDETTGRINVIISAEKEKVKIETSLTDAGIEVWTEESFK